MGLPGRGGSPAFFRKVRELTADFKREDMESLLRTANERRWVGRREPLVQPPALEQLTLNITNHLRHGGGLAGQFRRVESNVRALLGQALDTRDAETIATEFLGRVRGLERMNGVDDTGAHIARACQEVLEGIPTQYRRLVLERVLDIEEAEVSAEEASTLRDSRDERRVRGWRFLQESSRQRSR